MKHNAYKWNFLWLSRITRQMIRRSTILPHPYTVRRIIPGPSRNFIETPGPILLQVFDSWWVYIVVPYIIESIICWGLVWEKGKILRGQLGEDRGEICHVSQSSRIDRSNGSLGCFSQLAEKVSARFFFSRAMCLYWMKIESFMVIHCRVSEIFSKVMHKFVIWLVFSELGEDILSWIPGHPLFRVFVSYVENDLFLKVLRCGCVSVLFLLLSFFFHLIYWNDKKIGAWFVRVEFWYYVCDSCGIQGYVIWRIKPWFLG